MMLLMLRNFQNVQNMTAAALQGDQGPEEAQGPQGQQGPSGESGSGLQKIASINAAIPDVYGIYDEQGRPRSINLEGGFATGSVLGSGYYSPGSRLELDLYIQMNIWCDTYLYTGGEAVFRPNPIPLLNLDSIFPDGSTVSDWIADNYANYANWITSGRRAFPTPMTIEDSAKYPMSVRIIGSMTAALLTTGGENRTPGMIYAFGGFRAFASVYSEPQYFNVHMRMGFTRPEA